MLGVAQPCLLVLGSFIIKNLSFRLEGLGFSGRDVNFMRVESFFKKMKFYFFKSTRKFPLLLSWS